MKSFDNLADSLNGQLITPTDAKYDKARTVWNGTIDVRPAAIARCRSTEDVVRAIRAAVNDDLEVSIRGGGHNVAGMALVDGGLVIDLSEMRGVDVDPDRRIARVQGGATLGDIDRVTNEYGLMTPTGFVSETGIGGLALRGGLGHTMRKHGLSCDNIVGATLVTSDGEVRRITEDDTETLWALRGGSLDLGVVTEFEFNLYPVNPEVRLLLSAFPAEKGVQLNQFMTELMPTAPRELGLVSFYGVLPDDEELPAPVRDRQVIVLFGMYTGSQADAHKALQPILDHPDALADLGGWMTYPEAQSALDEEYPDGMRYYWKSLFLDDIDDEILDIIHRYGQDLPSPETTLDIWTVGGRVHEISPETSAYPQRDAQYMVAIEANWTDPQDDENCIRWAREVFDRLKPHSTGGIYMNFPGNRAEKEQAVEDLHDPHLNRLRAVQQACDPVGLFTRH